MRSRSLIAVFVFLFTVCCCLSAQTFRGSIQGTVTDPTGAAVPGAQVKVFSPATGLSRSTTTNIAGEYVASELPLGNYSISITKEGFRTMTLTNVPVSVGAPQRADAKLATGQVQEKVEVNADVPLVETASNTMGGTIEASEVAALPINGRDFTKLLELVPGTTSDPVGSTESAGSYGLFSANGNRGRSNNYLLDGTDMNDGYRNLPSVNQAGVWGCPSTILPVDALAEVPVTASPEAEFGRSSGATVNLVTKSGTNQLHGTFYEYYRNDSLSARNAFNTTDQPKNNFHNHQFGGSVGGPFVKDKSFWFFAYEGQKENGGLPQLGTAPTQSYIDAWEKTNTINPVVDQILTKLHPWGKTLPTSSDPTVQFAPVTYTTPFDNRIDSLIFKVDQHLHLFSDSDLLTGRYYYGNSDQSFPLGMLYTGSSAPGYNTSTPTHVNIVSLSYTSVPKTNLVVEVRGGYNRFLQDFYPQDIKFDPTSIGLNTLPPGFTAARDFGLPTISISGLSPIGATGSDSRGRIDTNYQLFGNMSLTHGKHNYKWGYEWRRTFINSFIDSGHRGKLSFTDTLDASGNVIASALDNFLAGNITGGGSSAAGYGTRYTYQNNSGTYFQDSWRVSNKLTLNYGLRWDYFGVIGEKNHAFSLFDPATDSLKQNVSQLYPKDWANFAPRVSIVDDVVGNGKLVVRAGAGMFYDGASQDFFVGNQPWNTSAAEAGPAFNNITFSGSTLPVIPGGVAYNGYAAGTPIFSSYSASSAFTVAQNLVTPRYLEYNLNLESQLTKTMALQVGYVGSQGRHLFRFRDINQVDPATGTSPYPNYVYINQQETSASSSYNSLQASLKTRSWHGFTSTFNYTWAHSIDNASDGLDFVPNAAQPDNSYAPQNERASSNFDVRHRVQWYWNYTFPQFKNAKWITNGWSLDGMLNFATGQPYTVSYLFENDYNGSGEWFGRPDVNWSLVHQGTGGVNLLNLAAFSAPCTVNPDGSCVAGTQHFGNEGRNAFNASNYTNMDFSVSKTQHLTERLTVLLRADFFNIFNHPNFSNPLLPGFAVDFLQNGSTNNAGKLTGTGFLAATATPDVGSGNPYLGGGGPRSAQFSVRFSF
ncbi:MAG TPA: carboxypeptidase-like regulatory domain-containing protein [Candidatus Acidoferrales bacterium]|nr:carboxypeptidase-like regulatory domain-containing protein [Candidatus Acidoferrales bacterium]